MLDSRRVPSIEDLRFTSFPCVPVCRNVNVRIEGHARKTWHSNPLKSAFDTYVPTKHHIRANSNETKNASLDFLSFFLASNLLNCF